MSELRKVSGPPSRIDRNLGRILVLLLAAVLVAIVKPWGPGPSSDVGSVLPGPSPTATPSPSPSPSPVPRQFDLLASGIREPFPTWEIWSAGTLASFSFAMRIDLHGLTSSGDTPEASTPPVAVGDVPTDWPAVLIPHGDRLELIAINRPLGYTISLVDLVRIATDGTETEMHAVIGVSPWPDHLTLFGVGTDADPGTMQPWPTGHFRLVLRIDPGAVTRTLDIVVDPGPAGSPAAEPSASPSGAVDLGGS